MPEVLTLSSMADAEPDLSTFENKTGLAEDMKFLASMPELCDVTFLVGDTREPVCAVKAVLAARSRVFQKMLYQAPSPQRKKEPPPRENKLRLFLKRSSEPLLNLQNAAQQPSGQAHQTLIIEEFEPDVFRQLIEYIHTGCVTLQPRTLLGVMNAADYYGLEELRRACAGFVQCCINVDTVCALLASAERYIQYKCTKSLVQKVLEFVDEHGNEVLNLGSFTLLPQHVVRLILAREELRADEFTKFQAALMWSKKYCDNNPNVPLKEVVGNFLEYIQFHKIPANVLMREIHPLGLVPYSIIMNALAYQADPASIDPGNLSPNSSRVRRHHHHHSKHLPKIRKAKSQSFRTRRSPSERRSPNSFIPFNLGPNTTIERKRSPSQKSPSIVSMSQQESKSFGSMSSKSPFSLSRQGTLRTSHSRKNSTGHTLTLNTGRRSPSQQLISPASGRRSPVFLMYDGNRTPLDLLEHRKSPTTMFPGNSKSPTGHRSPLGFGPEFDRRSPTPTVHVQEKSPTAVLLGFDDGRRSPTIQVQSRRSPINFPQGLNTLHVPPITVSNPSESCGITEKMYDVSSSPEIPTSDTGAQNKQSPKEEQPVEVNEPRKERSVMRELLAFVRIPSKKSATRTGKFAAAFSRAESNSATPLIRQSTFTSAPRASSGAAKTAVTKQLSEAGLESKMSLKLLNSKMSFRLRRTVEKAKDKKSSGEEISDLETDPKAQTFELDSVRFEKVGESYIKHEKIREETIEDATPSPVQIVNINTLDFDKQNKKVVSNIKYNVQMRKGGAKPQNHGQMRDENRESVDSIKDDGITINGNLTHATSFTEEAVNTLKNALEHFVLKPEPVYAKKGANTIKDVSCGEQKTELQCPTFEIMPPSRRSSFDPPRSPYLENLRSPCETDPEIMNLNRLDSAGDSFEMIDTDRNHESSFESRYPSSSHTSFEISRYQSTSCEDQTSSFEIIDNDDKNTGFDIRKSSIDIVDVETFQKREKTTYTGLRKSSIETHFDFESPSSRFSTPRAKKQISEPNKHHCLKSHYSASHRARSPLLNQTSSNYSSRDSHDSYSYSSSKWHHQQQHQSITSPQRSPFADPTKQHFPHFGQSTTGFICTDQRCAAIFEPRPCSTSYLSSHLTSSSEFDDCSPSPRRAASASPKHTFTFRIVLKKVDSSPDALYPSAERRRSKDRTTDRIRRRDSRKKRFWETGKSF
ncbi:serine-enriched protein isoform X2 [Contarinia nasturtii]|uniref:serine-enriched protein isoform X2 n=1 Tax=Contarinia nasturtii TaxID=265458 RepID=UPI0012D39C62|nr:serine-enriched protein isoform X2 [Contarinia nasturtii]